PARARNGATPTRGAARGVTPAGDRPRRGTDWLEGEKWKHLTESDSIDCSRSLWFKCRPMHRVLVLGRDGKYHAFVPELLDTPRDVLAGTSDASPPEVHKHEAPRLHRIE